MIENLFYVWPMDRKGIYTTIGEIRVAQKLAKTKIKDALDEFSAATGLPVDRIVLTKIDAVIPSRPASIVNVECIVEL